MRGRSERAAAAQQQQPSVSPSVSQRALDFEQGSDAAARAMLDRAALHNKNLPADDVGVWRVLRCVDGTLACISRAVMHMRFPLKTEATFEEGLARSIPVLTRNPNRRLKLMA